MVRDNMLDPSLFNTSFAAHLPQNFYRYTVTKLKERHQEHPFDCYFINTYFCTKNILRADEV